MITSKQNQSVKLVASLKQKKNRDALHLYVVEGEKMVADAIKYHQQIEEIFATEKYQNFNYAENKFTLVSDSVFKTMSDEVTPQGILALCKIPESGAISSLSHCLLLDRVQDPGNVGTITRLAVACGVKDIFSIDSADAYSQKAVRSSMSGIFHVRVRNVKEDEVLSLLRKNNIPLICAHMNGVDIFSFKAPDKFCLCVGNEGQGISQFLKDNADYTISVPMEEGIESLNVSVATGVTLYTLLKG